jgi:hypothetical protein
MKKLLLYILLSSAGLLLLAGIAVSVAVYVVFTPEEVTPIAQRELEKMAHASWGTRVKVNFERAELTYFSTFPRMGICLNNGNIVTDTTGAPHDTLLVFGRLVVALSVNPATFFERRQLDLRLNEITIENFNVCAHVSENGKANWDVLLSDTLTKSNEPQDSIILFSQLRLQQITLTQGNLLYDNRQQNVMVEANHFSVGLRGSIAVDSADIDLALEVGALTVDYQDRRFSSRLPVKITIGQLRNNALHRHIRFEEAKITAGILNLAANGSLTYAALPIDINTSFNLRKSSLAEVLNLLPKHVIDFEDKLVATGKLDGRGTLAGKIGNGHYPLLKTSLRLSEGSLRSATYLKESGLQRVEASCRSTLDFSGRQRSFAIVDSIVLQSDSSRLFVSGKVDSIFAHPFIDVAVAGKVDFTRLAHDLQLNQNMAVRLHGAVDANVTGYCFLDDLRRGDYGRIYAMGDVRIDNVAFSCFNDSVSVVVPSLICSLSSNTTDSIRGRKRNRLLSGDISLDTLQLQWKNTLNSTLGKLNVKFRTDPPSDTAIVSMSTTVKVGNMQLTSGDSIRLRAQNARLVAVLRPQKISLSQPEYFVLFSADTVRGRVGQAISGKVTKPVFKTTMRPHRSRLATMDSASRSRYIDSVHRVNIRKSSDLKYELADGGMRDFIRHWDMTDSFACEYLRLRTPYFPLRIHLQNTSLRYDNGVLQLAGAQLKTGTSDLKLTGQATGIKSALLRNGKVRAKFAIDADSMNFTELIQAYNRGIDFAKQGAAQQDFISKFVLADADDDDVSDADSTLQQGVFEVPRNIDLELTTKVKKVSYGDIVLKGERQKAIRYGKIVIRDQTVSINPMVIYPDTGKIRLSVVYSAPTSQAANLGLTLEMEQINISEIIRYIPLIDTLAPMLQYFEGTVDCNIAATGELDSLAHLKLPFTTASCGLQGKDMVFLSNETFGSLTKEVGFMNHFMKLKTNRIDSIAVEMILDNSRLTVFPFMVSVDDYSVAVGGQQNLNGTFSYHISLLKFPIKTRIGTANFMENRGADITGSLKVTQKPDIHMVRHGKYKDLFTPAREIDLTATTINIRKEFHEHLQKSISDVIGEPLRTRPWQPRMATMADSMQQMLNLVDTAGVGFAVSAK